MTGDTIAEILSRPFGDDKPIAIQEVTVTHVDGKSLPKQLSGRAVLQLNPKLEFSIYFDSFPVFLLLGQLYRTFCIRTSNNIDIDGFLQYSLKSSSIPLGSVEALFIPKLLPIRMISSNIKIRNVKFGIVNFLKFYGKNDNWEEFEGKGYRVGLFEAKWNGYGIKVREQPGFSAKKIKHQHTNDYGITHSSAIERLDGKTYSVSDAEDILNRLELYLSFVLGRFCGFAPIVATDSNDRELVFKWGTTGIDPRLPGSNTWLPLVGKGDSIDGLLPKFFTLLDDPNWRDTLPTVIDWYINGNTSSVHVAIILYQAALEAISCAFGGKKRRAEEWLRLSLKCLNIDAGIPDIYTGLRTFSNQDIKLKKGKKEDPYIGDGPEAIVQIRNDLIHSDRIYPSPSMELLIEAMQLSRWYIEVMLLRKLGYSGEYFDRIDRATRPLN